MAPTVGLPRMHKEAAELRDLLPDFVSYTAHQDVAGVVLEQDYGAGMGFTADDYLRTSPKIKFGSYEDCLVQDIVLVLRCPDREDLLRIPADTVLVSMFHYPTNPVRNALLIERGIVAVSLDAIVDDRGARFIENMAAVGWNGMEAAFRELGRTYPGFEDPARSALRVTILGSGAVAGAASFAATRYGDQDLRARMVARGVRGVEVTLIDHDLTADEGYLADRLARTDLLTDATRRRDPTRPIVPNASIAYLPDHAVILDLAADPYDFSVSPPIVKGIEGVPQGDLDQFVFAPTDRAYEELGAHCDTTHRRVVLSCYSWPGIHPRQCMEHYGGQLEPVMDVVLSRPPSTWDLASENHIERALARAEIRTWHHLRTQ